MTKKEVIKYLEKEDLDVQGAIAARFLCNIVFGSYVRSNNSHGFNYSPVFAYFFGGKSAKFFQVIPQKLINGLSEKIYFDYLKNPKSLVNKINTQNYYKKEIFKTWNYYKNKKDLSSNDYLTIFNKLVASSEKWWEYGVIGEDKGEIINHVVVPNFAKRHNLSLDKSKEIITALSCFDKLSAISAERKDFLDICLYILSVGEKNKKLNQKINKYIKNNFWFKSDFYQAREITPPSLLNEAMIEIKVLGGKKIKEELVKIKHNFISATAQKKKFLREYKLDQEDKKEILFAKIIANWFDRRKSDMMSQLYYLFSFLKDIAEKNNIKYSDMSSYTTQDVRNILKNSKKLTPKELTQRKRSAFMVYETGVDVKMFYGQDARSMLKAANDVKKHFKGGDVVVGQVASVARGNKIRGIVRVIHNPAEEKFKKDEILVASMTRVEFIPLMRKAKAVVTDEGGIACHAAIISRELGIPCIIGTKVATKVFKNGDLIELDTKKGTISKIP
jgi:phosphohistidine swiveling domain-containing protein